MSMASEGALPGWAAGVALGGGHSWAKARWAMCELARRVTPRTVWAQVPEGGGCESRKPIPHALLFPAPILTQILLPSEQEGSWDLRLPPPLGY